MIRPVIATDQGVTLIGGGTVTLQDLTEALDVAPVLVAADGGGDAALALGLMPDAVIGDMDSLSDRAREKIGAERVHHIPEQDSTDFTKCLTRIDAPFVIAAGFAGQRLDHTLAALNTMAGREGPPVIMLAAEDIVFLCPSELHLDLAPGTRLSLFPMDACRGSSTGLEWPIDGIEFAPGGRIGTSNRATGPVHLTMQGPMLVMLPRETLRAVLTGLGL